MIDIDWDAIYPVLPNARFRDYADVPDVRRGVRRFYEVYRRFLEDLEISFNGDPQRLIKGVTQMIEVKYSLLEIVRNPLAGGPDGLHAGPIFPGSAG